MTRESIAPDSPSTSELRFEIEIVFVRPRRLLGGVSPIVRRDSVIPRIDGVRLTESIDRFELDSGMDPAGGAYGGLLCRGPGPMADHFRGELTSVAVPKRALLACECGVEGCWPLLAAITFTEDSVIWDRFEQPFRRTRDYGGFGPFRFEREGYDRALRELSEAIRDSCEGHDFKTDTI